jgi:archaellum component FlaC
MDKLKEDTVSADRKERIIFDPEAWRKSDKSGRKTSAITSRQNFDNEKFTRKASKEEQVEEGLIARVIAKGKDALDRLDGNPNPNNYINQKRKEQTQNRFKKKPESVKVKPVDEGTIQPSGDSKVDSAGPTQSDMISKDTKPKKSNNPQIEFVTGTANPNGSSSTAIGKQPMTGRKLAEQLAQSALKKIKEDIGISEGTVEDKIDKVGKIYNAHRQLAHDARSAYPKDREGEAKHQRGSNKAFALLQKLRAGKDDAEKSGMKPKPVQGHSDYSAAIAQDYKDQEKKRGIGHVRDHVELEGEVMSEDFDHAALDKKFGAPRDANDTEKKLGFTPSKSHTMKDGKVYHWQDPRGRTPRPAVTKEEAELSEAQYAGLEAEDKPGKKATEFKGSKNSIAGKTVEGWKDEKTPVKEGCDTVVKDKTGKVTSWKHEGDWKKSNAKKNPQGKVHNLAGQALQKTKQLTKEEAESLEESPVFDAIRSNTLDMMKQDGALRHDARQRSHDRIQARMDRALQSSHHASDEHDRRITAMTNHYNNMDKEHLRQFKNSNKNHGGDKHLDAMHAAIVDRVKARTEKLKKEETNMSKTYNQFMEQLDQLVEFVPEAIEEGIKIKTATGYIHKGTRGYGNDNTEFDQNDDFDSDDKPKAKPADAPKRGRGRPSGSYGTYKARSAETKAAAAAKSAATKAANKAK